MKLILFFFTLILSFLLFPTNRESYYFDYLIKYKNGETGYISNYCSNSIDSDYFVTGTDNFGRLIDNKSNVINCFELINSTNNVNFIFKDSFLKPKSKYKKAYFIENRVEVLDENIKKITVMAFENNKKKKYSYKIILHLDNTEIFASKIILNNFFHGNFTNLEIENMKGIPFQIEYFHENGIYSREKLIQIKAINTTLKL